MIDSKPLPAPLAFALVGVGGALGTLLRYVMGLILAALVPGNAQALLWGTVAINVCGAFLLAALLAVLALSYPRLQMFIGTGLLGGFTTYSLFATDVAELLLAGAVPLALVIAAVTVLGGISAAALGSWAGNAIRAGGTNSAPRGA